MTENEERLRTALQEAKFQVAFVASLLGMYAKVRTKYDSLPGNAEHMFENARMAAKLGRIALEMDEVLKSAQEQD